MASGNKSKLVVSSISFIAKTGNFLINQDTPTAMWLNAGFIKQIYSNLGLSTKTSFQLLKGCTLQFFKLEVTDEMLAANGGEYKIKSNIGNNREITFTSKGMKFFDHSVLSNSAMLDNAIAASGVTFDDSWAGPAIATTAAAPAANIPAVPAATVTEDDGGDHVDLDDAAGAADPAANPAPAVNAEV